MHLWLDQGKVSNKVKMHPMVLRALSQPAPIRNASGNGGGLLFGFMAIVSAYFARNRADDCPVAQLKDPLNPDSEVDSDAFALYKRQVYNAIFELIFKDCRLPSHIGSLLQCGDGVSRVFHPEILIESLDGQEAGHFTGVRGPTAHYGFIKCLTHKDDLSRLVCTAPKRTVASMSAAYHQAEAAGPTQRSRILRDNGIHLVPVSSRHVAHMKLMFHTALSVAVSQFRPVSCIRLRSVAQVRPRRLWPPCLAPSAGRTEAPRGSARRQSQRKLIPNCSGPAALQCRDETHL